MSATVAVLCPQFFGAQALVRCSCDMVVQFIITGNCSVFFLAVLKPVMEKLILEFVSQKL
jgi:hypothetical protein